MATGCSPTCPGLLDRAVWGLAREAEPGDPEKGLAQGMMGEKEAPARTKSRRATPATLRDILHACSRKYPAPQNQTIGRF